jgi:rhamnulokinase
VDAIHLVGGGAQNDLLCRLTARAAELPVLAGPVEATALGTVLIQARAAGTISGELSDLRALLRRSQNIIRYEPAPVRG